MVKEDRKPRTYKKDNINQLNKQPPYKNMAAFLFIIQLIPHPSQLLSDGALRYTESVCISAAMVSGKLLVQKAALAIRTQ